MNGLRVALLFGVCIALLCPMEMRSQDLTHKLAPALSLARDRLRQMVIAYGDSVRYPRSILPNGQWRTVRPTDWTSGFFPGCLWQMAGITRDSFFLRAAERWTNGLESVQTYDGSHDIGFIMVCSFGNAQRVEPCPEYRTVLLQSARTLLTRYNPTVGCIRSWDNRKWEFPVIIDNMMNLELLFWASQHGGTRAMYDAAVSHAERTMKNHIRPDGSTYHVVDYDTLTGRVLAKNTHQGASDSSTWSRGQAWAIYGFTMAYRYSHEGEFLATAVRVADAFLRRLPADHVPYWDFDTPGIPNEPRDASAGAVAASGLLELSSFIEDEVLRRRYGDAAVSILLALAQAPYLQTADGSRGILGHSTGSKPAASEVDTDLIYGDYYFIEAMRRALALEGAANQTESVR